MQTPHALIVWKCDENLFDEKGFFNIEFQLRDFHAANLSHLFIKYNLWKINSLDMKLKFVIHEATFQTSYIFISLVTYRYFL